MIGKPRSVSFLVGALGAILALGFAYAQIGVDPIIEEEQRRIERGRQAQREIDAIVQTTQERADDYHLLQRDIDNLVSFNTLLQSMVDDQDQTVRDIRRSISQVTIIERQMLPLMTRMVDGLETFIELDKPFYLERRRAQVAFLRDLLTRSDVSAAEQFRFVLQAWQTEIDYGRYSETYTAEFNINGTMREVHFLMVGRVAFLYLTPDGRYAGAWDNNRREWVPLGSDYHDQIRQGIDAVALGDPLLAMYMIPVTPPEEGN